MPYAAGSEVAVHYVQSYILYNSATRNIAQMAKVVRKWCKRNRKDRLTALRNYAIDAADSPSIRLQRLAKSYL